LTQQLKIPPNRIILYGRSIGGGSATELATKHPIAGLILESTFTSAFRVVVPFPEPKRSLWIPDADHNDFMDIAGDRHRQALLQFQALLNPITSIAY
jgi:abhydrolase domain-containing protein 17